MLLPLLPPRDSHSGLSWLLLLLLAACLFARASAGARRGLSRSSTLAPRLLRGSRGRNTSSHAPAVDVIDVVDDVGVVVVLAAVAAAERIQRRSEERDCSAMAWTRCRTMRSGPENGLTAAPPPE